MLTCIYRQIKNVSWRFKTGSGNSLKLMFIGAGCGIVLFAIFGLLPGSFLGGVMGLNIAGTLLGMPVTSGILSRVIVAALMVVEVMVAGIFVPLKNWKLGDDRDTDRRKL